MTSPQRTIPDKIQRVVAPTGLPQWHTFARAEGDTTMGGWYIRSDRALGQTMIFRGAQYIESAIGTHVETVPRAILRISELADFGYSVPQQHVQGESVHLSELDSAVAEALQEYVNSPKARLEQEALDTVATKAALEWFSAHANVQGDRFEWSIDGFPDIRISTPRSAIRASLDLTTGLTSISLGDGARPSAGFGQ